MYPLSMDCGGLTWPRRRSAESLGGSPPFPGRHMQIRSALMVAAIAVHGVQTASAQGSLPVPRPAPTAIDSTAATAVFSSIYSELSRHLAVAGESLKTHAWRFDLPPIALRKWTVARQHLISALRARAPLKSDTVRAFLTLHYVRVSGDTLFARVTVGVEWRCWDRWHQNSTTHDLIGVWKRIEWEDPLRVVATSSVDFDPCVI